MKDFIEVENIQSGIQLVNINKISVVIDNMIAMEDDYQFEVVETYEEIKEKIRIAQEGEVILKVKEDEQ